MPRVRSPSPHGIRECASSRTSRHAAIAPSVTRKEYSRTGRLAASLPAPELSIEAIARFSFPREQTASTARFRLSTVSHQVSKFVSLLSQSWTLLKGAVNGFIEDEALTRGAAIAFYTATSFAPVLLIVIAIAGLVYGREAAQGAITTQLGDLMGGQTAELLQTAVASSKSKSSGFLAAAIGIITLIVTASGVFGEMQAALNKVWKAEAKGTTVGRLVQARAKSLGLVAALGFLLMVSLAVSAALTAFATQINAALPFGGIVLSALNLLVSLVLISFLFAAVFKVLPDCDLAWRDVALGAVITAVLFIAGKSLIGWYIGSSAVASTYGAAGGLIVLLLWIYYTSQIFLFGAELARAYAGLHGSRQAAPKTEKQLRPAVRSLRDTRS